MKSFRTFLILTMMLFAIKASALPPNTPVDIFGPYVCQGSSASFTVLQAGGADGFAWSVTGTGWSFSSATTTLPENIITAGPGSATFSVWAFNTDGPSGTITKTQDDLGNLVSINTTGGSHCTSSTITYTTDPVVSATDYFWTISGTGWSISNSSGTFCDVVGGTGDAVLSAWASNSCETSNTITRNIIPKQAPSAINALVSGPHCSGSSNTYSIAPVAGATSYSWFLESTDPGWSATSSTTTEFVVSSSTITLRSATISVAANNLCGSSATISRILDPLGAPTGFTLNPPGKHCINSTKTYTVIPVEHALSYKFWFYGPGWSATSNTMGYIEVTSGTLTTGNATLSVAAVNECGTSNTYTTIIETYYTPVMPDSISIPQQHCTGTSRTYTVSPVNQAASYLWSINNPAWTLTPNGTSANIVSGLGSATLSVAAVNDCGISPPKQVILTPWTSPSTATITTPAYHCYQDTTRYYAYNDPMASSWTWYVKGTGWSGSSTSRHIDIVAGPGSGTISVVAHGPCGSSSTYTTTMSPTFLPIAPERIYTPPSHCTGETKAYACTAVENATSYTWVISGTGWTGNSNSNYIDLKAGTALATITVYANTECGSSPPTRLQVMPGVVPTAPVALSKPIKHCVATRQFYAALGAIGANYYTWTIKNNPNATKFWSVAANYGQDIELIAGSHSATITVLASNECGEGQAYSEVLIPNTPPAKPDEIDAPNTHCEGSVQQYSINEITGAETYEWSVVGTGWSISSSNLNVCDVLAGSGTAVISVKAINDCGDGTPRTLTVIPDTLPEAPVEITKPSIHCVGSTLEYSIQPVPGATSYVWVISGTNWTHSASTATKVNITAGSGEATITAKAVNACGESQPLITTMTSTPLPSSEFNMDRDTIFKDETVTITYMGSAGTNATFDWNFDGGTANPGTGKGPHSVMWFNRPGNRTVRLIVTENGCESNEKLVSVYVRNATDFKDNNTNGVSVELIPNPSEGFVTIQLINAASNFAKVQVVNSLGQEVYNESLENVTSLYSKELILNNLESGSYFVKVIIKDKEIVKRLIIIK